MQQETVRDSRPVKIRMLVGDAIRICRDNPRDYFGMAAVVALAPLALAFLSMARDREDLMSPRNALPGLLQFALAILTFVYVMNMLGAFPLLAARELGGRTMRWTEAFSWLRDRKLMWGVFVVIALQSLAALGGLLLLVLPGIAFAVMFMLVIPARVLGDLPGREALSKSRKIVRPVLFKGALSFAGLLFVPWAVLLAIQVIFGGIYGIASTDPARVIPPALAAYAVTVAWAPVDGVAHALFYIERSGGIYAQREDLFSG